MSTFKVGDKVKIVKDVPSSYTYRGKYRKGDVFVVGETHNSDKSALAEDDNNWWMPIDCLEHFREESTVYYPNAPHLHCEIIKAWADGADIEVWEGGDKWRVCEVPSWFPGVRYRIKPQKTSSQLEKESIINEMETLKKRLQELETNS